MSEEFLPHNRDEINDGNDFVPQNQSRGCPLEVAIENDRTVKGLFRGYFDSVKALVTTPRDFFSHFGNDRSYVPLLIAVLLIYNVSVDLVSVVFFFPIALRDGIVPALLSLGKIVGVLFFCLIECCYLWLFAALSDLLMRAMSPEGSSNLTKNRVTLIRLYLLLCLLCIPFLTVSSFLSNTVRLILPSAPAPSFPSSITSSSHTTSIVGDLTGLNIVLFAIVVCVTLVLLAMDLAVLIYSMIIYTYGVSLVQGQNVGRLYGVFALSSILTAVVAGIVITAVSGLLSLMI